MANEPGYAEGRAAYAKAYRAAHPELREYHREWMREHRARAKVGTLHELACPGRPCTCKTVYRVAS